MYKDRHCFPANISETYKEYCETDNNVRKLFLLFDVFSQVIHFFGCVFLSEYLYSDENDGKVNDSIIGLARPSLGTWYAFMRTYVWQFGEEDDFFISEFTEIYDRLYDLKKFDKVYKGRFRNDEIKSANVFDEIIALRNQIAHGASHPDETDAVEILDVYDGYLDIILNAFGPIFEKYTVAKITEIRNKRDTYKVYFDLIRYDFRNEDDHVVEYNENDDTDKIAGSESIYEYLEEGKMYLLCQDGRIMKFAEYLVDIIDDPDHELYYLYDGYSNSKVRYIGFKYTKQLEGYLESIKTKLTEKGGGSLWKKKVFDFESFGNYVNDLTSMLVNIHKHSYKYKPDVYVERECDFLVDDFMESDKTAMVVMAEAGVGKTNFMCHTAEKLIAEKKLVYFYNCGHLEETDREDILFRKLRSDCLDEKEFRNSGEFLKFIDEKNTGKIPFVLILDAANEAYDTLSIMMEADRIVSMYGEAYPWLKIIISMRTVSYNVINDRIVGKYGKKTNLFEIRDRYYSVNRDGTDQLIIKIDEWNIIQVIDAFDRYRKAAEIPEEKLNYHTLNIELQEMLRNPLNMGIFFRVQSRQKGLVIESEEDVFVEMNHFWEENEDISKEMNSVCNAMVDEMRRLRCNELDSEFVQNLDDKYKDKTLNDIRLVLLTPLERLKDIGIVYEKYDDASYNYAFVYQKFLEYKLLWKLLIEDHDNESIISLMLESREWDRLPEMYIACLEYLKREADTAAVTESIIISLQEKGIDPAEMQTSITDLLKLATVKGEAYRAAKVLIDHDLLQWGVELVKDLNVSEESSASIALINALLENGNTDNEELYYLRGIYYMKVSQLEEAQSDFERCIHDNTVLSDMATVELAKNFRKAGNVPRAMELLDGFIDGHDRDEYYYDHALIQRGLCRLSNGDYKGALEEYNEALEISESRSDHHTIVYNMLGISTAHARLGEIDECERILLEVYKLAGKYGYVDYLSDCLNGLSANFVRKREYERAISYARQGLVIWKHSNYYTGQMVMYCTIMQALHGLGNRADEIRIYRKEAEAILPKIKEKVILEKYKETMELITEDHVCLKHSV